MLRPILALLALAPLAASACRDVPAVPERPVPSAAAQLETVPYDLARPAAVFEMPRELREISALTVLADGTLGTVQDESGTLYRLSPQTGAILSRETFRDRGDFEGVEQAGADVWALRSDGDLYRLRPAGNGDEAERFETDLASRNDAEGLAYDAAHNRLLVACKENPGKGLGDVRAVYAFDLATNTLSAAPVFTLDRRRLDAEKPFKPSAIAVRPGTGEIYVLSSVRKALAVLAPNGTIRAVVDLPEALFAQPEGLTFTSDGALYISNEGPPWPRHAPPL